MKNKPHNRICRGAHYHALAEGYAMLNFRMANSFHRAADLYDHTDPPLDLATETVDWAGEDLRRESHAAHLRPARLVPLGDARGHCFGRGQETCGGVRESPTAESYARRLPHSHRV
jgi:hypothetical protein